MSFKNEQLSKKNDKKTVEKIEKKIMRTFVVFSSDFLFSFFHF